MGAVPLLLLMSFHSGAIPASSLQNGVDAYTSGNYLEAVIEFRPLAETGDPQAQFNMGVLAFKGHGLPQDLVESYAWLTASGRQGFAFACRYRERVGAQLSPEQLLLARKRAHQRLEQAGHVLASAAPTSDEDWCPERSVN
jgi:TPR repeat protein